MLWVFWIIITRTKIVYLNNKVSDYFWVFCGYENHILTKPDLNQTESKLAKILIEPLSELHDTQNA